MGSARSTTLPAATRPGAAAGSPGGAPGSLPRAQSASRAGPGGAGAPRAGAAAGASSPGGRGAAARSMSAGRRGGAGPGGAFDTPRGFGEEGLSEEQELAVDLDSVKRERERLLEAIAHVKGSAGAEGWLAGRRRERSGPGRRAAARERALRAGPRVRGAAAR
jgi:hypothetical protein